MAESFACKSVLCLHVRFNIAMAKAGCQEQQGRGLDGHKTEQANNASCIILGSVSQSDIMHSIPPIRNVTDHEPSHCDNGYILLPALQVLQLISECEQFCGLPP